MSSSTSSSIFTVTKVGAVGFWTFSDLGGSTQEPCPLCLVELSEPCQGCSSTPTLIPNCVVSKMPTCQHFVHRCCSTKFWEKTSSHVCPKCKAEIPSIEAVVSYNVVNGVMTA